MSFEILKGAFDLGVLFEVVAVNSLGTSQLGTRLEFVLENYYLFWGLISILAAVTS